ncbi:MAG: hypothetical protein WA160_12350 [Pseudobdellovibrio sp.]
MKKFITLWVLLAPMLSLSAQSEPLLSRIISPGKPLFEDMDYVVQECLVYTDHVDQIKFNLITFEHNEATFAIETDQNEVNQLAQKAKANEINFEYVSDYSAGVEYYVLFGEERIPLKMSGRYVGENLNSEAQLLIQKIDTVCGQDEAP